MLSCQKPLFSLPPDHHYLNCAYMAPLLKEVEEAGIAGIRTKRNPAGILPEDFFEPAGAVRRRFAALVGVSSPSRIALLPAVSYGMAVVALNMTVTPGANVVILGEQFPSNVYVWKRTCDENDMTLRIVQAPDAGPDRGKNWNERLLDAIDTRTALVSMPHVHWADGTRFDLEAVGRRAREVGALFVIDGTQSVGALPFDVSTFRPDALICAGYKWLLGPYGLGLGYFGPAFDGGTPLEETWIARRGSEHFSRLVEYDEGYQPEALRYDVGERSNFILLPMLERALARLQAWGVDAVRDYCAHLTDRIVDTAGALGFTFEDAAWRAPHLIGIRGRSSLTPEHLSTALARHGVSASIRGTALRLAPHVYNDEADLDALGAALLDAVQQAAGS